MSRIERKRRIYRRVGECKDSKDKGRERGGEREGGRGIEKEREIVMLDNIHTRGKEHPMRG